MELKDSTKGLLRSDDNVPVSNLNVTENSEYHEKRNDVIVNIIFILK